MNNQVIKNPSAKSKKMPGAKFKVTAATVASLCIVCALFFLTPGCGKQDIPTIENGKQSFEDSSPEKLNAMADDFFYHFDEKIYLREKTDRIVLKIAPNIDYMEVASLLNAGPDLMVSVAKWMPEIPPREEDGFSGVDELPIVLLTQKDGKHIPLATLESFREKPEVVSAAYEILPYHYKIESTLVTHGGLTNEFSVRLKKTTSYAQLQALAAQHGCILGRVHWFYKNQFKLHVPKTSELNVIQMSILFYETRLFELSSPDVVMISGTGGLTPQAPTPFFWYYWSEKMYLEQLTDKILLKFEQNTEVEQIRGIISDVPDLRPISSYTELYENYLTNYKLAALETKNGKPVSSATFNFFKSKQGIVSVSYMYRSSGSSKGFLGYTDEFHAKLMPKTSYEQLQELAKQYNCTVGEQFLFNNLYRIYVSKTSDWDALKTSNTFYETGLFEYTQADDVSFGEWEIWY